MDEIGAQTYPVGGALLSAPSRVLLKVPWPAIGRVGVLLGSEVKLLE